MARRLVECAHGGGLLEPLEPSRAQLGAHNGVRTPQVTRYALPQPPPFARPTTAPPHADAPNVRAGFSKPLASIAIFFVSALLHELALSAPLQVQQGWAFVGMLAQVPMIVLTAGTTSLLQRWRVHESHIFLSGNAALWVSMCFIGQPMCVVLYIAAFSAKHDL